MISAFNSEPDPTEPGAVARRLNELLAEAGQAELDSAMAARFEAYFDVLVRWNSRMNLTALRDGQKILSRHFVESIACARALPGKIGSLLDLGSGAGFPGLPIAMCRPEVRVTLAESQGKKAAFLREAVRTVGMAVEVYGGRAEALQRSFDCVTLRAVDRMEEAVRVGAGLVGRGGWVAILTTEAELAGMRAAAGPGFAWEAGGGLPGGESRILLLGRRSPSFESRGTGEGK
jgi:16S rRNA (guanine527-N7)-methyltransferase